MGSAGTVPVLRIAILINGFASPNTPAVRASFISAIEAASVNIHLPIIDFYDPIIAQIYPDPSQYDLIVLSGGTADPMGADPWVVKLQEYLKTTVTQFPKQKIVGVCWGHQTIAVAFGGTIGNMEGPELGVTPVDLTAEGMKVFPFATSQQLHIHEFHRREIKVPPKGFIPLAKWNQSMVSHANTILTFQGHPEMNEELGKALLANAPGYMGVEDAKKEILAKKMESRHDGVQIWTRVLEWVGGK